MDRSGRTSSELTCPTCSIVALSHADLASALSSGLPIFILAVIFNGLIAALAAASGALKLRRDPKIVKSLRDVVRIPESWLPTLAALEIAGAVGVVAGLWITPLGIAAGIGLVLYFIGAVAAHVRVGDTKGLAGPGAPLVLSALALALRIVSA